MTSFLAGTNGAANVVLLIIAGILMFIATMYVIRVIRSR